MGIVQVKTVQQMNQQNRIWWRRVEAAQVRALMKISDLNLNKSREIAEQAKFKGTLLSKIQTKPINKLKIQVISSAPHSYAIEKGEPSVIGWVSFSEEPGLEGWVRNKLMRFDPKKAQYFLGRQAVKIGMKGFPYGFPKGLRFMELGFQFAAASSSMILGNELMKLST